MKNNKRTTERIISDLYSLELDAERVIPKYLDSRLQKEDNLEQKQGKQETSRPQCRRNLTSAHAKFGPRCYRTNISINSALE